MKKCRKRSLVLMAIPWKILLVFLCLIGRMMATEIKTVNLPGEIINEMGTREVKIKNKADQEIYDTRVIHIYDDFIYYQHLRPIEHLSWIYREMCLSVLKKRELDLENLSMQENKGKIFFLDTVNQSSWYTQNG